MFRRNKQHKLSPATALLCGILLISVTTAGGVLAKYVYENVQREEMIAQDFHISSDFLKETNPTYTVADLGDDLQVNLYNYELENTTSISEVDIDYTVTVSDGFTATPASGTFNGGTATMKGVAIRRTDAAKSTVTVTVTTKPYAKTLKATFTMTGTAGARITAVDKGTHYLATLTTGAEDGSVTVQWPAQLQPDNTNPNMRGWTTGSGTINVEAYTTYELIFFNPDGVSDLEDSIKLS